MRTPIAAALLLAAACSPAHTPGPAAPPDLVDGWAIGDAVAAGFDDEALRELTGQIEAGAYPNTHALLIEHDGALVYERYFSGTDERWGEPLDARSFGPADLHDVRSISKSVTSLLLGIALADVGIESPADLDEALARPVLDHLPGVVVTEDRHGVSLHHVLTMTAGLEWNEGDVPYTDETNDEIRLYGAVDPAAYVLARPLVHEPGTVWYYSGGTTQILASVIRGLTGKRLDEFAHERLFAPLGIEQFEWLGPGSWTPDEPAAMSGLRLRPRDLARIGSLVLHGGRWNELQIVPAPWIERSGARHVATTGGDDRWGYGYQWWIGQLSSGERVVAGFGNGNQRLFVLPAERLVVTVLAGEYNRGGGHSNRLLGAVLEARRR